MSWIKDAQTSGKQEYLHSKKQEAETSRMGKQLQEQQQLRFQAEKVRILAMLQRFRPAVDTVTREMGRNGYRVEGPVLEANNHDHYPTICSLVWNITHKKLKTRPTQVRLTVFKETPSAVSMGVFKESHGGAAFYPFQNEDELTAHLKSELFPIISRDEKERLRKH